MRARLFYYNVNPKGKATTDCVIRAIAYASHQNWDKVYTDITQIGIKEGLGFNEKRCEDKYLEKLGFVKYKQPRKDDGTKYLANEIGELVDLSKYDCVIRVAHHLTCCDYIDGQDCIIDIWDCGYKSIGNYYLRRKTNESRPLNCDKKKYGFNY